MNRGRVLCGKGSSSLVIAYVQIAAAVADGDGLEHVNESATTPEGRQIHAFMDPISAMGKAD